MGKNTWLIIFEQTYRIILVTFILLNVKVKLTGKFCSNEWLSNYSNGDTRKRFEFQLKASNENKYKTLVSETLSYITMLTTNSYITNKSLSALYNTTVSVTISNFHTRASLIYHITL